MKRSSPYTASTDCPNRTAGFRTSRGRAFTVQTIIPMLENPAYAGRCVYNRSTFSKWHRHVKGESVERLDEGTERRPESDWIVRDDAWPAIIDRETFVQVQARRRAASEQQRRISGTGIRSEYLLTGLAYCGVCGARLCGQTTTSGKGYRTAYYICGGHHAGKHADCPKRYTVPAKVVEDYIVGLIEADLVKLRDDDKLYEYIAGELAGVNQQQGDARRGLQRRIGELDQHLAKLRDHLKVLDSTTAESLGLYAEAKQVAGERSAVECRLNDLPGPPAEFPGVEDVRALASAAFDQLETVLEGGSIEEKRELIGLYVQRIKADPEQHTVQISLYPALFSREIAGAGLEPATSGL